MALDARPREAGNRVIVDDDRADDAVGDARRGRSPAPAPPSARRRRRARGSPRRRHAASAMSRIRLGGRGSMRLPDLRSADASPPLVQWLGPNDSGSSSPSVTVRRRPSGLTEIHRRLRSGKLAQALAAAAAGADRLRPVGDHQDRRDRLLAGRDHDADGRRLGALPLRIGGVLDIAAGIEPAALAREAGAHGEARIGRMGIGARGVGGRQHVGDVAHRSFT